MKVYSLHNIIFIIFSKKQSQIGEIIANSYYSLYSVFTQALQILGPKFLFYFMGGKNGVKKTSQKVKKASILDRISAGWDPGLYFKLFLLYNPLWD